MIGLHKGLQFPAMLDQAPRRATRQRAPTRQPSSPELSVVMPCLNEAETIGACITDALQALRRLGIDGEVVVADNGSTDGSPGIARRLGVRVVIVRETGYGSALQGGIRAARGRYVLIGDADQSYDFSCLGDYVEQLRDGSDFVIGNRFLGGIDQGAMPWLHRHLGTPVLTWLNRLFFGARVGDINCGMRAFTKAAYARLGLRTQGMEFASEMVIKAALMGLRTVEVPTPLRRDGRSRQPHLRTWRDGWRHLRFMLLYSPRWLFLYPGAALMAVGAAVALWLLPATRHVGAAGLDVHTLLIAAMLCLVGYQVVVFAVFTKVFAVREGLHPPDQALERLFPYIRLETGLAAGSLAAAVGLAILVGAFFSWQQGGPHELDPRQTMRLAIPAVTLLAVGIQTIFASFFLSILGIDRQR